MVNWEAIEIELLPEERELLLKYGYPSRMPKRSLSKVHRAQTLRSSRSADSISTK